MVHHRFESAIIANLDGTNANVFKVSNFQRPQTRFDFSKVDFGSNIKQFFNSKIGKPNELKKEKLATVHERFYDYEEQVSFQRI